METKETTSNSGRTFELRSEKVRSIVGQIPSSLVRYGITIIGVGLFCLFFVAYLLPYKQVYSGVATIHAAQTNSMTDSTEISILLNFDNKRPTRGNGQTIVLQSVQGSVVGKLLRLSSVRDTLDRQAAYCRFSSSNIQTVENQSIDFQMVQSSGNLLQKMLGGL